MFSRNSICSAAVVLSMVLAGCDGSELVIEPVFGPGQDAATLRLDAGFVAADGGSVADAGFVQDAGDPVDAGSTVDSGLQDAGEAADAGFMSPDSGACDPADQGDPDKDRVVLLGHSFGAVAGTDGTEVRSLSLSRDGVLADDGMRLDVGVPPEALIFRPDGAYAFALSPRGALVSIAIDGANGLSVVDQVMLPSAGFGDMVFGPDGHTLYVTGSNVGDTSGISTVHVGCEGDLTMLDANFHNVRLAQSLALFPDGSRAILLGGQTVFDPVDPLDTRLLSVDPFGFTEVTGFDLFIDMIDALRIDLSPDARTLVIPNGSPFSVEGGQVLVVDVDGNTLTEVGRILDMGDARSALFSPDGATVLISRFEPGRVSVLADEGAGLELVDEITGVGLAEQMAQVEQGTLSGRVFVTSTDASGGPNIAILQIDGPGVVSNLGQLDLGSGSVQIPTAISVTP